MFLRRGMRDLLGELFQYKINMINYNNLLSYKYVCILVLLNALPHVLVLARLEISYLWQQGEGSLASTEQFNVY